MVFTCFSAEGMVQGQLKRWSVENGPLTRIVLPVAREPFH
jgi:hypothetical protein